MRIESGAATHVGCVRTVNEDSYLAFPTLGLVADGMGGHAAGDVASALTVKNFEALSATALTPADVTTAVATANEAILAESRAHPEKAGMGTTVSGVALVDQGGTPHWLVFNVGDSRVYRVTSAGLAQLTVDHSEVAELIATGQLDPANAKTHPLRNVVTRSLGTMPAPEPDTWLLPVEPLDLLLVCSDGLTRELTDDQIATVVHHSVTDGVAASAQALVDAAVAAGGHDNVTAVLLAVRDSAVDEDEATATLPRVALEEWA